MTSSKPRSSVRDRDWNNAVVYDLTVDSWLLWFVSLVQHIICQEASGSIILVGKHMKYILNICELTQGGYDCLPNLGMAITELVMSGTPERENPQLCAWKGFLGLLTITRLLILNSLFTAAFKIIYKVKTFENLLSDGYWTLSDFSQHFAVKMSGFYKL